MTATHILAVGRVHRGAVEMDFALPPLQTLIDAGEAAQADADALIDSLFAMEVEEVAFLDLSDPADDAYAAGQTAYATGCYAPPAATAEHDAYISGYNDAWKRAENVRWWRR
jgi:hypothetical protein